MTPEEKLAIDVMKVAQAAVKLECFELSKYLVRGDISPQVCGFKTVGDGLISYVNDALKKCDKIEKEFLKKFPDK